jgi:hypothetical protein
MIDWTPVDILTCLEAEPAVDEEGTSYRYTISRHGLVLALEIWPYDNDVWIAIRQADREEPVIDLRMEGCREIRYVHEGGRETLDFVGFDERSRRGGWRLRVAPHIEVKLGDPPAG